MAQAWEQVQPTGLAGAPSADSESPRTRRAVVVLATSLDCRGLWPWHNCPLSTVTAADAVQFFDWMAMAGEARRRGWMDWQRQT